MTAKQLDIIKGVFFGQAIGDALGLGTEFLDKTKIATYYPNGLTTYSQIIQDKHRVRWEIGDWTDDTDQFLCICNSILKTNEVSEIAFAEELYDWFKGVPMGIGQTVYKVVSLPQFKSNPHKASALIWKMSKQNNASNGAIMRTSILGTFDFWDYTKVVENTEKIAKTTHWDNRCVGSCVVLTLIISNILFESKMLDLKELYQIADNYDIRIQPYIEKSFTSPIEALKLDDEESLGYTLKAMSAGLWTYFQSENFEEGILKVINEGGDADTNACVAGSILGAKFGFNSIPKKFIDGLIYKDILEMKFNNYIDLIQKNYSQKQVN